MLFQAEDGIREFWLSRGLGEVYKRQELERRRAVWVSPNEPLDQRRGYDRLYATEVGQADEGCDFEFLLPLTAATKGEAGA